MATRRPTKNPRHRTTPDPLAQKVGARIRELRRQQDFSFDAFVEEVGLGRGYVSELERGLVVPSLTALAKLAKALDLTIADLVLGDTPRERLFELVRVMAFTGTGAGSGEPRRPMMVREGLLPANVRRLAEEIASFEEEGARRGVIAAVRCLLDVAREPRRR